MTDLSVGVRQTVRDSDERGPTFLTPGGWHPLLQVCPFQLHATGYDLRRAARTAPVETCLYALVVYIPNRLWSHTSLLPPTFDMSPARIPPSTVSPIMLSNEWRRVRRRMSGRGASFSIRESVSSLDATTFLTGKSYSSNGRSQRECGVDFFFSSGVPLTDEVLLFALFFLVVNCKWKGT